MKTFWSFLLVFILSMETISASNVPLLFSNSDVYLTGINPAFCGQRYYEGFEGGVRRPRKSHKQELSFGMQSMYSYLFYGDVRSYPVFKLVSVKDNVETNLSQFKTNMSATRIYFDDFCFIKKTTLSYGASITRENIGSLSCNNATVSIGIKKRIGKLNWSIGLSPKFDNYSGAVSFPNQLKTELDFNVFNMDLGIALNRNWYNFGVSVYNLLPTKIEYRQMVDANEYTSASINYQTNFGLTFFTDLRRFHVPVLLYCFTPVLVTRDASVKDMQANINVPMNISRTSKLHVGLNTQFNVYGNYGKMLGPSVRFNHPNIDVSYSWMRYTSRIASVSSGMHTIGIRWCRTYKYQFDGNKHEGIK